MVPILHTWSTQEASRLIFKKLQNLAKMKKKKKQQLR